MAIVTIHGVLRHTVAPGVIVTSYKVIVTSYKAIVTPAWTTA